MNLLNDMNTCFQYGDAAVEPLVGAGVCPNPTATGHPFIPLEIQPLWGYEIRDSDANTINVSDSTDYNASLTGVVSFDPAPQGLNDVFGFFSFVITGARFMVNTFFMTLFGFPSFLTQFNIPAFVTTPIGVVLFVIQMVGMYEFLTGRDIFAK